MKIILLIYKRAELSKLQLQVKVKRTGLRRERV